MRRGLSLVLIGMLACAVAAGGGCGSNGANKNGTGGGPSGDGGGEGGVNLLGDDDGGQQALVIQPENATLNVTAPGVTQQFQALVNGNPTTAQWTLDSAGTGTINPSGLFTASGLVGGLVEVTATAGALTATTGLTVHLDLTENPGNVNAGTQGQLQAGGTADPGFAWLYPYDQTVWPRDLPAPTLQFAAGADAGSPGFDAALVQVTFAGLNYQGFYGPAELDGGAAGAPETQIALTATAWNAITLSASGSDAVKVQVTKISGGLVTGPITETWTIAQGGLRGSIFYNSYNSALAAPTNPAYPAQTGAVLKLRPAEQQLSVVISTNNQGECHVCHAVAANGSIMEAANEPNGSTTLTAQDSVYDLLDGGAILYSTADRTWDFGAFTPDGTKFLRYGAVPWTNPAAAWVPDVRGMGNGTTDVPSALFDPRTGASIPAPGLDPDDAGTVDGGPPINMMMPTFSPDGKMVAFNHYDTGLGHTVAVMNFDTTTNTFSNLRDVATLPATNYAGWPTFTPDDQFLFFASGTNPEYDTISDSPPNPPQPQGNLYIAHIPSATIASADALNGVRNGTSYLPFPDDPNLNFEPTILPVASGGYYWVVFTTRRNYGNTINGDPYVGPDGPSPRKKLWVAAIDIAAGSGEAPVTMATDITHPAFYLDGQELAAGNMRAFWALDPCEQNGVSCQTGDQCCSGFCRQTTGEDGGVIFACVTPPTGCSQENEACTTAANCCGAAQGYDCINGFCAEPTPK